MSFWLIKACGEGVLEGFVLLSGIFPVGLKDLLVLANYCPVSDLVFLGKVVERVKAKQLQAFLEDTSILDPFESCFCSGHGMENMLAALIDDL